MTICRFAGMFDRDNKRMMGLEPTTSCMASASDRSLPFAPVRSNRLRAGLPSTRANGSEPERTPNLAILATEPDADPTGDGPLRARPRVLTSASQLPAPDTPGARGHLSRGGARGGCGRSCATTKGSILRSTSRFIAADGPSGRGCSASISGTRRRDSDSSFGLLRITPALTIPPIR
jgi:hypothetical protein